VARTRHANAFAVIRRSTVFRIALISALIMAIGGRPAVSHAQSNPGPGQKESEQVVQPINFRLPEPLDFDDHPGSPSQSLGVFPSRKRAA
jgi:hypothetical protein